MSDEQPQDEQPQDEQPQDEREPEQAQLDLDEPAPPPEVAPPPDPDRAPPTEDNLPRDDGGAAAEPPTDTLDEPPDEGFEDLLRPPSDVALDEPPEDAQPGDGTAIEGEASLAPDQPPASAGVDLPTSWPDPVPVGTPTPEPTRFEGVTITPPLVILAGLVTLSFLLFVAIEPTPRWLLLFTAIIAVLGTDGALRQAWPRPFSRPENPQDSTPYLFLPALAAVAWPMLIEHNVRGYLVLPATLFAGVAFAAMLVAQVSSVRERAPAYPLSRLVSTAAVYFTAFALFSLSYVLDVDLPAAVIAVAVIAAMLGVELFREGEVDPLETLIFAGVTGVILAEARWAMYYVPVGGYLAGLALLLGFFLVTGLLHSHLTRRLNNVVALEYAGIASAGVLLVTIAGQAGLG